MKIKKILIVHMENPDKSQSFSHKGTTRQRDQEPHLLEHRIKLYSLRRSRIQISDSFFQIDRSPESPNKKYLKKNQHPKAVDQIWPKAEEASIKLMIARWAPKERMTCQKYQKPRREVAVITNLVFQRI